jgi:hypothetical protein
LSIVTDSPGRTSSIGMAAMIAAGVLLPILLSAAATPVARRPLSEAEILEAMRESQGFELRATTNGARLQAEVALRLARRARAADASGAPLFLGHAEWFAAYLKRTQLRPEQAPLFVRLAFEHRQEMEIDYRGERVLESVESLRPELALNVRIWWPDTPGAPQQYSYDDTLATPRLRVTNKRVITYRLLDFGDMVVFDQVEGLLGRPTTGLLGMLFRMIGEGSVEENRMAISRDGLQIARARARKALFEVATTLTVYPDGRTEKEIPPDRPDLAALEARLKQPLRIRYRPLER